LQLARLESDPGTMPESMVPPGICEAGEEL